MVFSQDRGSRTANKIFDIPAGGGLHGFLPDPDASSSSAVSRDERGQGVFRSFPHKKKVRSSPGRSVRSWWARSARGRRLLVRRRIRPLMSSSPWRVVDVWVGPRSSRVAGEVLVDGWPPWSSCMGALLGVTSP